MNLTGLQTYLGKLKHTQQASMAKLIHNCISTNDFLHKQGRADTNIHPRCNACPETVDHITNCCDTDAQDKHQQILYDMLLKLTQSHTSIHILSAFEERLTTLLNVKSHQ